MQKLTLNFKNQMRNLNNFGQVVESPKCWNLMSYFCPKNTFLQLKSYTEDLSTLLSTTCSPNPLRNFWNHKSFFTTQLLCVFLAQTLHTLDKSIPSKFNSFTLSLLPLKFTKFFMSFFKQKVSFSSKFEPVFRVMRDNSPVLF